MKIKNIIFDLGGVLLNLDVMRTNAAFAALVGNTEIQQKLFQRLNEEGFWANYEIGALDTDEFIERIQNANPNTITAAQIQTAWSAMLLDFPKERIEFLRKLKAQGFKLFLLSNINYIHLRDVYAIVQKQHGLSASEFDALFDKVYYSHLIQKRKPDLATYQFVLDDANINPQETLFFDDLPSNILAAQRCGILAQLHPCNGDIEKTISQFIQF